MDYKKMTDKDRKWLIERGFIKPERSDRKPVAWKLVWRFGGRDEIIKPRGTYPACVAERKRKSRLTQYQSGEFKILPLF